MESQQEKERKLQDAVAKARTLLSRVGGELSSNSAILNQQEIIRLGETWSLKIKQIVESVNPNAHGVLPAFEDWDVWSKTELPEPPMLVDGILHQGNKMVLGGGSKSFKTWALTDLAISIATGKDWWGFKTVKMPVLYVNFEIQPCFYQKRIREILACRGIQIEPGMFQVWNLRGYAGDSEKVVPRIIDRMMAHNAKFGLCVLDPTYKLMGGGKKENEAGDVAALLNDFETVAVQTGAAVAFGAHFSKGNQAAKESMDRISGSGVFARDPDVILTMTRHEEDDCFTIDASLRNCPPTDSFVVQWHAPIFDRADHLDANDLRQSPGGRPTNKVPTMDEFMSVFPQSWEKPQDAVINRGQLRDRIKANKWQRGCETMLNQGIESGKILYAQGAGNTHWYGTPAAVNYYRNCKDRMV